MIDENKSVISQIILAMQDCDQQIERFEVTPAFHRMLAEYCASGSIAAFTALIANPLTLFGFPVEIVDYALDKPLTEQWRIIESHTRPATTPVFDDWQSPVRAVGDWVCGYCNRVNDDKNCPTCGATGAMAVGLPVTAEDNSNWILGSVTLFPPPPPPPDKPGFFAHIK